MFTTAPNRPTRRTDDGRRLGYAIAVLANAVLLYCVLNVLEWDVLPFLTGAWAEVVPWSAGALVVSILANLIYQFDDSPPVRATGDVATNLIGLLAAYRLFEEFPFDFSAYAFDWAIVARVLLVLAMVGAAVAIVVAVVGFLPRRTIETNAG